MSDDSGDNFGLIRAAVMILALTSLVVVCGYFVVRSFGAGSAAGIRSTSGVLLPFVVGGFLVVFKRDLIGRAAAIPPIVAFVVAFGFGIIVMLLMKNVDASVQAPIAELIVASGLSLFLYAPGAIIASDRHADRRDVWMAYYFGTVSGMLGYVVLLGFPFGS